jgi:lipopolysaccharide heptosyltransferase II
MQRQVNSATKWLDRASGWTLGAALGALARATGRFGRAGLPVAPREILIVKFCCMGDAVLVLPALRALKEKFPGAHVTMLCTPRTVGIFGDCPHLDEVQLFQLTGSKGMGEFLTSGVRSLFGTLARLRARRFDLAIDFDNYYNGTTFLSFLAGIPMRIGFDPPRQGRRFLLTHPVRYAGDRHMVEFYLDLVRAAGVEPVHKAPEIRVGEDLAAWAEGFLAEGGLASGGRPRVALSPGRSEAWHFIRWSEADFAATGEALHRAFGARVLLVGGPAEVAIAERMQSALVARGVPVLSAVGKASLHQSEALMRACDLLVCNDSGPMHLAAAVGTPTLAVFGPANHLRWGPYGPRHRVARLDLDCSPCLFMGKLGVCPRVELECLGVPAARVIAIASEMLRAGAERPQPEAVR